MEAIHETSLGMFSQLDLSQVLQSIIKRASYFSQIPDGVLFVYNSKKNILEMKAGWGKYFSLNDCNVTVGEGILGKVWESGESIIVNDYQSWSGKSQKSQFDFITSAIGIPLISGSKIEGTIKLSHHDTEKSISRDAIDILWQFAELATYAIDNFRLFESLKKEFDKRIELENERKEMEARLRQSQKMEAIGTLAGGIAHDFNNILFPVIGFSEMIMQDLPEDSPIKQQLQPVLNGALRAKDLVQQILTFSRETEQNHTPLKMQLMLKEVLKLARASLPATIKITKDIPWDVGMVMADPTQIHQVAMNLITNALHSMEEKGGELSVILKEINFSNHDLPAPEMIPGPYVCLTVIDTGSGMNQDTRKRIFDPYFTTKDREKGTGLGLAVVHGIVKNLQGKVIVQSQEGKGSSFSVYLPRITQKNEAGGMDALSASPSNGNESILLIDDEIPILHMLDQMVSRSGYKVTSHNISTKALEIFKDFPYDFDLVITDMTMPGLTGDKLISEIKNIRPDIPVILCTGYSEKIVNGRVGGDKPDKIIMKPADRDKLLKDIRCLLGKNN